MPYSIRKVGSKYCLYLKASGQKLGCHSTQAEAEAQRSAIEIQKHATRHLRHVHLRGATGEIRVAKFEDRDHLVVPVVALMQGIIWPINAPTREYVPADVITVAPAAWNGRPVFSDHPVNEMGQQVSGNSPAILATAIGKMFDTHSDGTRLLTEVWVDPMKCEALGGAALETLQRLKAGEIIEVSVGTFVVTNDQPGTYLGKPYEVSWQEVFPDHLALLPKGEEGACSVAMGCGVRALHVNRVTADGFQIEEVAVKRSLIQRAIEFLRVSDAQDTNDIKPLYDAVVAVEPEARAVEDRGDHVVYAVAKVNEDPKHFQRAYMKDDKGVVKLSDSVVEVLPVISYEPADLVDAKGARHSAKDMAVVQSMHDHAVELGAQCAPKAMTAGGDKPCGCHKETIMKLDQKQRDAKATALKAAAGKLPEKPKSEFEAFAKKASGDLLKAVIDQVIANGDLPFTEDDRSWLEEADENRLLSFAGFKAGDDKPAGDANGGAAAGDGTTPVDDKGKGKQPAATDPAAPSYSKAKTVEEFLKDPNVPAPLKDMAKRQIKQDAERRAALVKVLKTAQTEYTEKELGEMDLEQVERIARACKAEVAPKVDVDFSGRAVVRDNDGQPTEAPAPIDMNAKLKERAAAKRSK